MRPSVLTQEQATVAGSLIARAFHHEGGANYLFPDPTERARFMPAYFGSMVRLGMQIGTVEGIGNPLVGVAVWAAPSVEAASGEAAHGDDLPEDVSGWPLPAQERLRNLHQHLDAMHSQLIDEPHWQLLFLGIDAGQQGRGLGGQFIAPRLAAIDAAGLPCTLQTFDARNLPFYERNGFHTARESKLPGTDVKVWDMRRG